MALPTCFGDAHREATSASIPGASDIENTPESWAVGGRDAVDPEASTLPGAAPRCSEVLVAKVHINPLMSDPSSDGDPLWEDGLLHGKKFVNSQEEPLGIGRPVLSARHGVLRRKGFHLPTASIAQLDE